MIIKEGVEGQHLWSIPYGDHVFLAKESNLPMIFRVDKNLKVVNVSIQTSITDTVTAIKED